MADSMPDVMRNFSDAIRNTVAEAFPDLPFHFSYNKVVGGFDIKWIGGPTVSEMTKALSPTYTGLFFLHRFFPTVAAANHAIHQMDETLGTHQLFAPEAVGIRTNAGAGSPDGEYSDAVGVTFTLGKRGFSHVNKMPHGLAERPNSFMMFLMQEGKFDNG